jgi:hypothetical protein
MSLWIRGRPAAAFSVKSLGVLRIGSLDPRVENGPADYHASATTNGGKTVIGQIIKDGAVAFEIFMAMTGQHLAFELLFDTLLQLRITIKVLSKLVDDILEIIPQGPVFLTVFFVDFETLVTHGTFADFLWDLMRVPPMEAIGNQTSVPRFSTANVNDIG